MKRLSLSCILLATAILTLSTVNAQDTFSIVAVDASTGEVGSAGASCLDEIQFPGSGGVTVITEVLPGIGALNSQAAYDADNQFNARVRILLGDTPQEAVDWLEQNDVDGQSDIRQYGIAILDSNNLPLAAAFTGANCLDYKSDLVGTNYAIQGNILLGQQILDDMEAAFLNTTGTLADKLMAAMQGANVPGADTRCLNEGVSSLSAFIKVARPSDSEFNLFLDLEVPFTPFGVEPIDSLQILFDIWKSTVGIPQNTIPKLRVSTYPNPISQESMLQVEGAPLGKKLTLEFINISGQLIQRVAWSGQPYPLSALRGNGVIYYRVFVEDIPAAGGKLVMMP